MPFTPWQRPDALALAIRTGARRIAALNQFRTQTKNQLHAAQLTATTPHFLIANRQQSIAQLEAQIEHLRQQVLDLIAADEQLQNTFALGQPLSFHPGAPTSAPPACGSRPPDGAGSRHSRWR